MVGKAKFNINRFDVRLDNNVNYGLIKYYLYIDDSEFKTALVATLPNLIQFTNDGSIDYLNTYECSSEN